MKRLIFTFAIVLLSSIILNAQNQQSNGEKQYYETEARNNYKIDGSGNRTDKSNNIIPLKVNVIIERGKVTIGQTIYYLGTGGSRSTVPSGDIAYKYWGRSDEYNDIGIQVNYSIDTKRATMIYISIYGIGVEYAYALKQD